MESDVSLKGSIVILKFLGLVVEALDQVRK